tara:strand:- start:12621 stop:14435 length:1815 start_codon:yes stop_codon:yes gene_type:complete
LKVSQLKTFVTSLTISLAIFLIIIFTIFISSPARADENSHFEQNSSFDKQLAHADKIRSAKPKEFLVLVNELNQHTDNISAAQQHSLDYLNLYLLIYQGDFDKAITSAKALLNSTADALLKFRTKISLVNIFAVNQNWTDGLSTLSILLSELPLVQDKKLHHQGLLIAAIFYNQLGQYNLSRSYAKRFELQSNQGREQCFAKAEIIESTFKLKQLTPSAPLIKHAISLCRINNEHLIISVINSSVAKMHLENQQPDKALHLLNSTLQDTLNTKYPRNIAIYYSLLAQAHWLNKNTALTKQFALQALEYENKEDTTQAKVLSYKLLFEVFQTQENYKLALFYHQKYTTADKLYYNETQAKYLAFQIAEHQTIEQENKINLLHEKNVSLKAKETLNRTNRENNQLIIMTLALTLLVLTFWGYRLLRAHKRIKELAEYDALTGIFNRGHFTHVANNAIRYCQSADQELSMIMFDLDYFKKVNDSYGHACGDWALKKTVEVCQTIGRQNDIFARLGGEEFCLLLTSCDKQAALKRTEACRKAIAEINTKECGFDFTITASFGISDAKTSGYNLEKLLADADSATYDSKDAGRNQVTLFQANNTEEKVV